MPEVRPVGGVALHREWVADWAQMSCSGRNLTALLVNSMESAELAGLLIAALRLDVPAVVATPLADPFAVALAALGVAPLVEASTEEIVEEIVRDGGPRPGEIVDGFSLANSLRAGLALGGGPELLVHLAAMAREAGVTGFTQTLRVLIPESPKVVAPESAWFNAHGPTGFLAYLGDALHDRPTVVGRLKETLPPAPPAPQESGSRLIFVRGRASGTEVLCRVDEGLAEVSGDCRIYSSEGAAVRAVWDSAVYPDDLLVVAGCGPRGGPGLLRLDSLGDALREAGLVGTVPVLTDGLSPEGVPGVWASLTTPEAAVGGIIGRLRSGDRLRLDFVEARITTGVRAGEIDSRETYAVPGASGTGYVARYAGLALPALEGAGFD
ncbi:MAG: dihydroxy-acid dehydratase [Actinomycetota bacterium]|nr:dihydroxy-acid dehydratase [Actinomycetota bacterium]